MNEQEEKAKLLKVLYIIIGLMLGGTVLILGSQAAWNFIQQRLQKSAVVIPTPTPTNFPEPPPPPTPTATPTTPTSITETEALNLISSWLAAKSRIFAPPYDTTLAATLTTGKRYQQTMGSITWLSNNNARYEFLYQDVKSAGQLVVDGTIAKVPVDVTEDLILYVGSKIDSDNTSYGRKTKSYVFSLQLVDGNWKIADVNSRNWDAE
ncbi:MAG: hypothetical protein Fur0025_47840 [Oscillatoriaceae cyanobacterium]